MSKGKSNKQKKNQKNFEKNEQKIRNSGLILVEKNLYVCPKCGNAMKIKRKLLVKSPVCRNCLSGQSFGEDKAISILTKYRIQYEKEKTFGGLKGIGNKKLRFDFYIKGETRDFILEIDGEQHKNGSEWGANTDIHDKIKNQFCADRNIALYRIKYKFGKLDILERELMKVLKAEFSENMLKVGNERTESSKNMTDDEISKAVKELWRKKFNTIPKGLKPVEKIVEGLEVTVKIPKWLAKEKCLKKLEKGVIKKVTEKAILLKSEQIEFWLPKSYIKIYIPI